MFNAAASAIVAGMADPIALIQAEEIIALIVDGKVPAVTLSFTA